MFTTVTLHGTLVVPTTTGAPASASTVQVVPLGYAVTSLPLLVEGSNPSKRLWRLTAPSKYHPSGLQLTVIVVEYTFCFGGM